MPTYEYRCGRCAAVTSVWRSIHATTIRELRCSECGAAATLLLPTPMISADALPNKREEARRVSSRDQRWDRDMAAYRRLRRDGLQPPKIDGSAALEAQASSAMEIEMGRVFPKEQLGQALDTASEILGKDVTETGRRIREARRGCTN